jgi:hypothetical protein
MAKATKKPQPRRKAAPAKAPAAPPFQVTHYGKNVHIVDCDPSTATGWEQWLLLRSDAHTDSGKCNRDLEQKHLRQALERSAIICDLGDCLDLMQGASDRRQCKSQLRSSHAAAAYFDAVINEVAERYEPYAQHWAFLGQGNHESAWLKHHETCPTTNLVRAIKSMNPSSQMGAGGYGGWMKVRVTINNSRLTWTLRYHHGSGGGAPMSMGVLDSRRMFSWVEGADMIAVGHNHHSNIVGIAREYLETRNGVYEVRNRHCDFVRCGTYKADWGDGSGGWIVEKGPGPTSLRAKWVRLHVKWEQAPTGNGSKTRGYPRLAWDVIDAN